MITTDKNRKERKKIMARQITMNAELLVELLGKRGFVLYENNRLQYMSGSIANYAHLIIGQPTMCWSLITDSEVEACYVKFESYQEPGYIECDWKRTEEGYVAVDKLLTYLDEKGIRNSDEVKREREERLAKLKALHNA